MHNLISQNQLAEWNHIESDVTQDRLTELNDYYDCVIDEEMNHGDKRICRSLLPK
jgi:hypothetical protein